MTNNLIWLLNWYYKYCNGDWEHQNGIKIGTIDNPGWYLKVNLNATEIQNFKFKIIDINRSEDDWLYCSVNEKIFEGFGGPFNFIEILEIFRQFVEEESG
ncbi:MAG: immunity 53 family protein [Parachlamydiaceae bacterium]